MATTPTLEQYLAGKQAVFKPTKLAATSDSVIGSGDSAQFVPGNVARDSTFDTDQATSDYYKQLAASRAPITSAPGRGVQDFYGEGERKTGSNWNELANLIGFKGPVKEISGRSYNPGEYTQGENSSGVTGQGWEDKYDMSYDFKNALKDYRFAQKNDRGAPAVDIYDPSGKLFASQRTQELPQGMEKYAPMIAAAIATAATAGTLGPALGGMLGLGEAGLTAMELATLGELGINTAMLDAGVIGALGTGATNAGMTALKGGDLGDVLTSGATGGIGSYVGSSVNSYIPSDVTGTGIDSLNAGATGAIKGATSGGVGALLRGDDIGEAALMGGLGGGFNSAMESTLKGMGIPRTAIKLLGPAAIATMLNKDPTGALIKAAISQIPTGKASGGSIQGNTMRTKYYDGDDESLVESDDSDPFPIYNPKSNDDSDSYPIYNPKDPLNNITITDVTPPNYSDPSYNQFDPSLPGRDYSDPSLNSYDPNFPGTSASGPATTPDKGFGSTDWAKNLLGKAVTPGGIAALMAAVAGARGANDPSTQGYQGVLNPKALTATQTQLKQPAYVPYSGEAVMGRRQLSDMVYAPPAPPPSNEAVILPGGVEQQPIVPPPSGIVGPIKNPTLKDSYAMGGIADLAGGGSTGQPRYLRGHTDGMADKIDTDIDGKQAAKLSHGEFVIPADVVSHLGNGNSDAGANVLYKMMDRVRKARTGNHKQGKEINPAKFMPGGLASLSEYADGGAVAFQTGGTAPPIAAGSTTPVSTIGNLSTWSAPGVVDYINKGTALSNTPYQAYEGPLTAGYSPLQKDAFKTAGDIKIPTAQMGAYTPGTFDAATAQKMMNPYLQASLDPQLAAAKRQAEISQVNNAGKATQAGAFGGSRGAIMSAEGERALGANLANITGQGYNTAFTNAQNQFNTEVGQQQTAQNATNAYGLQALGNVAGLGATQRGIEAEGIGALKNQFEEERNDPYKKLALEQSLYAGLPVSTGTTTPNLSAAQKVNAVLSGVSGIYDNVNKLVGP